MPGKIPRMQRKSPLTQSFITRRKQATRSLTLSRPHSFEWCRDRDKSGFYKWEFVIRIIYFRRLVPPPQRRYRLIRSGLLALVAHCGFRLRIDDLVAEGRYLVRTEIGKRQFVMLSPLLHFLLCFCCLARVQPMIAGKIYGVGRERESSTGGFNNFHGAKEQVFTNGAVLGVVGCEQVTRERNSERMVTEG